MKTLRLAKHHGLSNDFLIALVDRDGGADELKWDDGRFAEVARYVCDRREGAGADGLLVGYVGGDEATRMVLYNADGGRAEISGNGIRCLAHAIARQTGSVEAQTIVSDAGEHQLHLTATDDPLVVDVSTTMGAVSELAEPHGWADLGVHPDRPVAHLSLGNPHTVVPVDDLDAVDLVALGTQLSHVNLEIVAAGPGPAAVTMRVHERGAGITAACGSGACATAVAAARWGIATPTDGKLVVHMDGGAATVVLGPSTGADNVATVELLGPTTFVATIDVAVRTPVETI